MTRLHVTVRGRVQGVGFRWFARETAERLGVGGWIRNRPGGDVEAEAQGAPEALAKFLEALRSGHPYARVDAVDTREIPAARDAADFEIR